MVLAALREHSPGKENEFEARVFLRHPDTRIVGLCCKKASPQSNHHQPPLTSRPRTGKKSTEQMNLTHLALNHLAKTVALGLAVPLEASAIANNKASLQVREGIEVNGQQLTPG